MDEVTQRRIALLGEAIESHRAALANRDTRDSGVLRYDLLVKALRGLESTLDGLLAAEESSLGSPGTASVGVDAA